MKTSCLAFTLSPPPISKSKSNNFVVLKDFAPLSKLQSVISKLSVGKSLSNSFSACLSNNVFGLITLYLLERGLPKTVFVSVLKTETESFNGINLPSCLQKFSVVVANGISKKLVSSIL